MRLALLSASLVLVVGACKRQPPPSPEPVAVAPPRADAGAPPRADAGALPRADAGACTPLAWQDDGMAADDASFVGTLDEGAEGNASNELESFFFLELSRPVCAADGTSVSEIHVYEDAKGVHLKPFLHKRVTIVGGPFAQHTAHHHRPIVVAVAKVAPAP